MSLPKYMEPFLQNLKYMLRDHKFPKKDGKAKKSSIVLDADPTASFT